MAGDIAARIRGTGPSQRAVLGTGLSRVTGLARTAFTFYAFYRAPGTADLYNVANNVPNIVVEYLGGGLLLSVFSPPLFELRDASRRIVSVHAVASFLVGSLLCAVAWLLAPQIAQLVHLRNPHSSQSLWLLRLALLQVPFYVTYYLYTAAEHADGRFFRAPAYNGYANALTILALAGYLVSAYGVVATMALTTVTVALPPVLLAIVRRDWLGAPIQRTLAMRSTVTGWAHRAPVTASALAVNQIPLILALRTAGARPGAQAALVYAITVPITVVAVLLNPVSNVRIAEDSTRAAPSARFVQAAIALGITSMAVTYVAATLLPHVAPSAKPLALTTLRDAWLTAPGITGIAISYYYQRIAVLEAEVRQSLIALAIAGVACIGLDLVVPRTSEWAAFIWAISWLIIAVTLWALRALRGTRAPGVGSGKK